MKFWCFYIPVLLENTATATLKLIIGVSTAVSSRKAALLVSSWLKPVFKVGGKCFASLFLLRFTVCRNRLQEAFNEGQTSCFLPTSLREILGAEAYWPLLLSSSCVPAFAQLLFLPWFPESPRYLLIDRGDELSCAKGNSQWFFLCIFRRLWWAHWVPDFTFLFISTTLHSLWSSIQMTSGSILLYKNQESYLLPCSPLNSSHWQN